MRNLSRLLIKLYLLIAIFGAGSISYAQIVEVKSITCNGTNDGQLNVISTWGTAPYTYSWTKNAVSIASTDSIIKGLSPGVYKVTVTDALSATNTYSYTLAEPAVLSNSFVTSPNTTWPANNGSFIITTTGGSGSNTYIATDSLARTSTTQTNSLFSNLAPSTYYLTTTDISGCYRNDTITVGETAAYPIVPPTEPLHTIDTTACYFDMATSSVKPDTLATTIYPIKVYFDDMTTPYKTIIGFKRGTNKLANNVTDLDMIFPATTAYFVTGTTVISVGSNAGKDSAIVISSVSSEFAPGFHILKVVTADGKGYQYSWDVDSTSSPIAINTSSIVHNLCFEGSKGSFSCTAEGSYEGFTYAISGPTGFASVTTASASNLKAGVYTFTATDVNETAPSQGYQNIGCSRSEKITINQPDEPLRIVFDASKNASCPYSLDGAVNFRRVDGATYPVSYSWSSGETTPDLSEIKPGTYVLTITDANLCTVEDSVTISGERKNCFYNIITPNGDGLNDQFDLSDFCIGVQMKAVIFNEAGKKIAELDENNPTWDAIDPALPPTGTSSTYTCFVSLFENGVKTVEFAESFSVVYQK